MAPRGMDPLTYSACKMKKSEIFDCRVLPGYDRDSDAEHTTRLSYTVCVAHGNLCIFAY